MSSENYIYLFKNSKTKFVIDETDTVLVSPTGPLMLGNHMTIGILPQRNKKQVALMTHFTFYTKILRSHKWARGTQECNITLLPTDDSDVSNRRCESKNPLTNKFEQHVTDRFINKYKAPQLKLINRVVSILKEEAAVAYRHTGGAKVSILNDKRIWKRLHDSVVLHPRIASPALERVLFVDGPNSQLYCYCDYMSGERKIFGINPDLFKIPHVY